MSAGALKQLQEHYDVELTNASNAIEGNTPTLRETAEVIEHGVTVGGKPLRDHLEARFRLTAIHPFGDGNGRTARLLMNSTPLRLGYPLLAVGPEDRSRYLHALERASLADDLERFMRVMRERLDATLEEYVGVLKEE